MAPTDSFWGGVGDAFARSPWWAIVGCVLVIGVLFVVAKYIYPGHKEIKMRELDIRQREAENDSDRIRANAALAENMRGVRESNDALAYQSAALVSSIEESKARSRTMGADVARVREDSAHVRETTDRTAEQVNDIHRLFVGRGEVTD